MVEFYICNALGRNLANSEIDVSFNFIKSRLSEVFHPFLKRSLGKYSKYMLLPAAARSLKILTWSSFVDCVDSSEINKKIESSRRGKIHHGTDMVFLHQSLTLNVYISRQ
jgi:hypothetical protein